MQTGDGRTIVHSALSLWVGSLCRWVTARRVLRYRALSCDVTVVDPKTHKRNLVRTYTVSQFVLGAVPVKDEAGHVISETLVNLVGNTRLQCVQHLRNQRTSPLVVRRLPTISVFFRGSGPLGHEGQDGRREQSLFASYSVSRVVLVRTGTLRCGNGNQHLANPSFTLQCSKTFPVVVFLTACSASP